jgi:WD40 repeat protein
VREYTGPTRQATYVAFVPGDPPRLAAVTGQAAYLWRLDRPDPTVLNWEEPPGYSEPLLSASPDGRWLVTGPNTMPRLWDRSVDPPSGHPFPQVSTLDVARLVSSPTRLALVQSVRNGGSPVVYAGWIEVPPTTDRRTRSALTQLRLSPDLSARVERMSTADWRIQSALSDDGTRLAVAPRELPNNPLAREAFVWDVGTGKPPRRVEASGHPCALSFSPDGSRLVIDVGTVYVHDTATLEVVASWKAKYDYPRLAWSPDGKLLARTDNSTTVRVYEAATGRQVLAVGGKRGRLVCAAFSPDGLMLATATSQGPIRVWDVE